MKRIAPGKTIAAFVFGLTASALAEPAESGATHLLRYIGNYHAMMVHFPIALVLVAVLAETLFIATGKEPLRSIARFNLALAALGAAIAVPLGLAAGYTAGYEGEYDRIMDIHRALGIATLVVSVAGALAAKGIGPANRGGRVAFYRVLLLLAAILVVLTGHFGGTLIFGLDYLSWP